LKKTAKDKPIIVTFFIPVYEYYVWTQFGGSQDSFLEFAKRKLNCDLDRSPGLLSGCIITVNDMPDHCMWFRDKTPDANVISHEVFHSICHALRHKGIWPVTKENEEAFAYLIGGFTNQVVIQAQKNKKKRR
jgi:hypothetical protein